MPSEAPRGLDPVDARHPHVHEDDVRREHPGRLDGLRAVARLADHLEIGLGVQDQAEAGAHELLVVGEQEADAHGLPRSGRRARTT